MKPTETTTTPNNTPDKNNDNQLSAELVARIKNRARHRAYEGLPLNLVRLKKSYLKKHGAEQAQAILTIYEQTYNEMIKEIPDKMRIAALGTKRGRDAAKRHNPLNVKLLTDSSAQFHPYERIYFDAYKLAFEKKYAELGTATALPEKKLSTDQNTSVKAATQTVSHERKSMNSPVLDELSDVSAPPVHMGSPDLTLDSNDKVSMNSPLLDEIEDDLPLSLPAKPLDKTSQSKAATLDYTEKKEDPFKFKLQRKPKKTPLGENLSLVPQRTSAQLAQKAIRKQCSNRIAMGLHDEAPSKRNKTNLSQHETPLTTLPAAATTKVTVTDSTSTSLVDKLKLYLSDIESNESPTEVLAAPISLLTSLVPKPDLAKPVLEACESLLKMQSRKPS